MIDQHKPDILSCIANLSSDEVFTPPKVVNEILDLLPRELFENPRTTFLDPCCKSGVFLREIAKRLLVGLESAIPDLQKRIDHIFHNQLFGLALTELTGLMSRRSVYCSKDASGQYSVSPFKSGQGHIRFKRCEHDFYNGKCRQCGASQSEYDRGEALETHAYSFIHTDRIFNDMQFDVIIGNPPYQLSDGGHGASAIPIYHLFVQQAKRLNPRYLTMIIPARWYAGGRGLDEFREEMLNDTHIRILHDFYNSEECFPGIDLSGGVCYFLWDRDNSGLCKIFSSLNGSTTYMERPLLEKEASTFIRFNETISILKKIKKFCEESFINCVSSNDPFGYDVRVDNSYLRVKPDIKNRSFDNSIKIHYWGKNGKSSGFIERNTVRKSAYAVDKIKIFISRSYGERGAFPYLVIGKPFVGNKDEVCTETYILLGTYENLKTAENVISYVKTKFFRFLVMMKKNTQSATRQVYEFVPIQDFSKPWTDEELYKKYGLNDEEIAFIDSMIRPME